MSEQNHYIYEFGAFRLDVRKRLLVREGEIVALKPKAFDTLLALVERSGHVLEKDALMRRVWPDTAVEEGNLTFNISNLRKALGDDPRRHEYIVTIPGEGYKFVAGVRAMFDELIVHESTSITIEEEEEAESENTDLELGIADSQTALGAMMVSIFDGFGFFRAFDTAGEVLWPYADCLISFVKGICLVLASGISASQLATRTRLMAVAVNIC